ncbi:MAG: P1 family peptidase [Thermoleophilaceae bacterium]|nr:P1 family peptidase [Thermoleophilaceae bacterium]
MQAETYAPGVRERLRELGYAVGRFPTGERNALVDVPDVRVGHTTLADGAARTGVTAVLPHGGNVYAEKVLGGSHAVNAYGKPAGLSQLAEMGTIESPILITSTVSVGPVWEGGLRYMLERNPAAARDRDTINVIVGECFDGWLSDARALTVRPEHALDAIAAAREDEAREGAVGAGTGTTCFGFKSGVGTSSRLVDDRVLGCLVVSNYGTRRDLHMLTGRPDPAADGGSAQPPTHGGSVLIVVGTDAPVSERQLRRLAVRAALGLGRAGSFASNASGEFAIAFSTAHRVPHWTDRPHDHFSFLRDDSSTMRRLFEAAGEVVQECVLGSLCSADVTDGRDGHRAEAFPYELLSRMAGVRARAAGAR